MLSEHGSSGHDFSRADYRVGFYKGVCSTFSGFWVDCRERPCPEVSTGGKRGYNRKGWWARRLIPDHPYVEQETILKPIHRIGILVLLVVSFVVALSAQDSNQSLGDLARQERERRQKQSGDSGQTDALKSQGKEEDEVADASEAGGLKEGPFKANILITDSSAAIEKWVLMPVAERPGAGRLRQLTPGKKFYFPFVVTGYIALKSEEMDLTAHVRLISPDGKTLFDRPRFLETIGADPISPTVIVMMPVMDITFDTTDLPGTYTIRVTVTDHVHSAYARAEEKFQLIQGKSAEGKAAKKPATDPQTEHRVTATF